MKKVLFLLMILVTISSQSQTDKVLKIKPGSQVAFGYLTKEQFVVFKDFVLKTCNYKFSDESTYLINYRQPQSDCHYNQYENNTCDISWFEKNVFNKIEMPESMIKFYFQHKPIYQKGCASKTDLNEYLYTTFFEKNNLCYGLIVINEKGEFRVLTGEYESDDINKFIKLLNIK